LKKKKKIANLTFFSNIEPESFVSFEDIMNENLRKGNEVNLYIGTNGGYLALAEIMVDIINNYPYNLNITYVGMVYSAGMLLFSKIKRPFKITDTLTGMLHYPYTDVNSKNLKDEESFDYFTLQQDQKSLEFYLSEISRFLSDLEIQKIKNGKEVYLDNERMREMYEYYNEQMPIKPSYTITRHSIGSVENV